MITRWVRARLLLCAVVLSACFVALARKAWTLQVHESSRLSELGRQQYARELVLPPPRGSLRDASGVELAVTVDVSSAFTNPREIADVARTAAVLAPALRLDVREVEEKLSSARHFEWLRRRLSPDQARLVKALALPGVGVVPEPRRFYPARELAGTVLGFAGLDGRGLEGLELGLDALLRGERAAFPVVRDRKGVLVIPTEEAPRAIPGADVTLTLDRFLQWTAERALADGVRENQARAGLVVILDPRDGAVLAMASTPGLDPNDPAAAPRGAKNRPVTDAYEPGSVMKIFSVVSALDAGAVTPGDLIDTEGGKLAIGRHTISDTHKGERMLSVAEVIKYSSNVGAVKIARRLGKERLHDALLGLGFGERTRIELPGEARGRVRDAARWGESGLATISYGYGIQATPLQIAAGLATIADGGVWHRPHLVKRVAFARGQARETPIEARRVLGQKAADEMREMMAGVMQKGGTGEHVAVPGFALAGKTGTAYKHDPVTKKYSKNKYLSSFIGFAPLDDPRVCIVVMIDEPSAGKHYGGSVAGPVFAAIAADALKYLGVPPTQPVEPPKPAPVSAPASETRAGPEAEAEAVPEILDDVPGAESDADTDPDLGTEIVVIPDFTGMSVGQAIAAARERGVELEIDGSGRAVEQFPPAGRALKSIVCHVTFDPG